MAEMVSAVDVTTLDKTKVNVVKKGTGVDTLRPKVAIDSNGQLSVILENQTSSFDKVVFAKNTWLFYEYTYETV